MVVPEQRVHDMPDVIARKHHLPKVRLKEHPKEYNIAQRGAV